MYILIIITLLLYFFINISTIVSSDTFYFYGLTILSPDTLLVKHNWLSIISLIWDEWKNIRIRLFFRFNTSFMNIIQVLENASAHFAQAILIWSEIGAKPISRPEFVCLIWWIAIRKHAFKKEWKIKQLFRRCKHPFYTWKSNQMRF
jgi:hypothetical protein